MCSFITFPHSKQGAKLPISLLFRIWLLMTATILTPNYLNSFLLTRLFLVSSYYCYHKKKIMLPSLTTKREFIPVRKILLKRQTNPYTHKKLQNLQPKSKGKLEKKILKVRKTYQELVLGFTYLLLPHCLDQSTCLIAPSETWKLGLFNKRKDLKKKLDFLEIKNIFQRLQIRLITLVF